MDDRFALEMRNTLPSFGRSAPPFTGRRPLLERLIHCVEEAKAGRPWVMLIEGEAGIGKTRLLKELQSLALQQEVQVCLGRGYENLTLPYLPFIEALRGSIDHIFHERGYLRDPDTEILRRFFFREQSFASSPRTKPTPFHLQEKLRLFLTVARIIILLAQQRPLLFLLDDLHWIDRPSLDLFNHLIFTISDMAVREPVPLFLMGTYRPVEPETPLAQAITRLQREAICQTTELHGLHDAEITELIRGLGIEQPSNQLITTLKEITQGNPLFIQEVLYHLIKQGALQERGGYIVTTSSAANLSLPNQVTSALVIRLQELSENCQRVLMLAAFLGERFSLPLLSILSNLNEDELLILLEEGMQPRLLLSEGEFFQFVHPLLRHVCYHEASPMRRQRIHYQIAQAMEQVYADTLDAHAQEIAHHLIHAGALAEKEKVLRYARQGGDQAFAIFAWGEAARYYEATLSAAESLHAFSLQDRAALQYQTGLAYYRDMDIGPCLDHYGKAIEAYRQTGDVRGQAHVLMGRTRAYFTQASVPYGTLIDLRALEDIIVALGERDPELRGQILEVMAEVYWHAREAEKAREMARRALTLGQHLQSDRLCAMAAFALGLAQLQNFQLGEALESWQESVLYARKAQDLWLQGWPLTRMPLHLIRLGRLEEAEALALEAQALTRQTQDWAEHSMALAALVSVAVVRGDFAAAERYAYETMLMVSRSRYPWGGAFALPALAYARALRGMWVEAEDALDLLLEPGRVFAEAGPVFRANTRVYRQLIHSYVAGNRDEEEQGTINLSGAKTIDPYVLSPLCALIELGDLTSNPNMITQAYQVLSTAVDKGAVFPVGGLLFLIPRILGVAASFQRWWDKAETHFRTAIEIAIRIEARPELGRTYLDYARMLGTRPRKGDRRQAIEFVRQAISIFRELQMEPFVQRATQLAQVLRTRLPMESRPVPSYPDNLSAQEIAILLHLARGRSPREIAEGLVLGTRTITDHIQRLFHKIGVSTQTAATHYLVERGLLSATPPPSQLETTSDLARSGDQVQRRQKPLADRLLRVILVTDMEGSTALIQHFGDVKAQELLRIHNAIIRACLRTYGGSEVIHTGDGIEASFASAFIGVECARAIQQAFAKHNHEYPNTPIRVRIGLHAGEPLLTEGRLFGTAVHIAFRVCACAQPGQILASQLIHQLTAGKDLPFIDRGFFTLHGFPEHFHLYEVPWEE